MNTLPIEISEYIYRLKDEMEFVENKKLHATKFMEILTDEHFCHFCERQKVRFIHFEKYGKNIEVRLDIILRRGLRYKLENAEAARISNEISERNRRHIRGPRE